MDTLPDPKLKPRVMAALCVHFLGMKDEHGYRCPPRHLVRDASEYQSLNASDAVRRERKQIRVAALAVLDNRRRNVIAKQDFPRHRSHFVVETAGSEIEVRFRLRHRLVPPRQPGVL